MKGKFFRNLGKAFLWILITTVGAFGVGALITLVSGQFNPKQIYITSLSINGEREFVDISKNDKNYTVKVDFEPANANLLALTPRIVTGSQLIEKLPSITAGEEFTIEFAKDEKGITKGGEVEIQFRDAAQNSHATLKLLIDVSLNNNSLEISTNGSNIEDTLGQNISTNVLTVVSSDSANRIKIGATNKNMLNASSGEWSASDNNAKVQQDDLKKMILIYNESSSNVKNIVSESVITSNERYYLIKFLSPASTKANDPFDLNIFIYKTYSLQEIFPESLLKNIETSIQNENYQRLYNGVGLDYDAINSFINNYVYSNSGLDERSVLVKYINNETGLIELTPQKYSSIGAESFKNALHIVEDYVFVRKTIKISVNNVTISNINIDVEDNVTKLNVLQQNNWGIEDIVDNLGVSLNSDEDVDKQVLVNNLWLMDIYLCSTDNVSSNEVKVGNTTYYKYDGNKNNYLSITKKQEADQTIWSFDTLCPTPSASDLYLVYEYTNIPKDGDSVTIQRGTYYYHAEHNEREIINNVTYTLSDWWKDNNFNDVSNNIYSMRGSTNVNTSTLNDLNETLKVRNAISASVVYTGGSIQFSAKNDKTSVIAINNSGSLCKGAEKISNEISYKNLSLTVGNNDNYDVYTTSSVENKPMDYTTVKWFVKVSDNLIVNESKTFEDLASGVGARYYIRPIVNGYYNQDTEQNPLPNIITLRNLETGSYYSENDVEIEFMEIGTGDTTIEALNSLPYGKSIPIYAVIVQTDINGKVYINDQNAIEVKDKDNEEELKATYYEYTYNYVSITQGGQSEYPSGRNVEIRYYLEEIRFYTEDNEESSESNALKLDSTSNPTGKLSLSNNILISGISEYDNVDETILKPDGNTENRYVLFGAIDKKLNEQNALDRFYREFISGGEIIPSLYSGSDIKGRYEIEISNSTNEITFNEITFNIKNLGTAEDTYLCIKIGVSQLDSVLDNTNKIYHPISTAVGYFILKP